MEQKKNIYETTFIVNAGLDDLRSMLLSIKCRKSSQKTTARSWNWQNGDARRFAYPIKKKNNGFYVVFEFKSSGDLIARLERHFLLEENIIRFLIIGLDKKALQARISGNDLMKLSAPATPSHKRFAACCSYSCS